MAAPCSSNLAFDIALLFQNVLSFGFKAIASVYRSMDREKSLPEIFDVSAHAPDG